MSDAKVCYAYQIEVRDGYDSEWEKVDIMVSPPGDAPRQVLDTAVKDMRDHIRVNRIKNSETFLDRLDTGWMVAIKEGYENTDIEFEDATLERAG